MSNSKEMGRFSNYDGTVLLALGQSTVMRLFECRETPEESLQAVIQRLASQPVGAPLTPNEPMHYEARSWARYRVTILGSTYPARNGRELQSMVIRTLADRANFLENLSAKRARVRRFLARTPEAIYPGRSDLARDKTYEVLPGWWIGTNSSCEDLERFMHAVCRSADLVYGKDLRVEWSV